MRTALPDAGSAVTEEAGRVRLDKWLWAARFFKTRSAAQQAIDGGHVRVEAERAKPGRTLRRGDRLAIVIGSTQWDVTVLALSDRRGPAQTARGLYAEDPPSAARRAAEAERRRAGGEPAFAPGGRPEKRQRRQLDRMRGR